MTKCTKDEVPTKFEREFFKDQIKVLTLELKDAKEKLKKNPRLRNARFYVKDNTERIKEMRDILKRKVGKDMC